MNGKAPKDKPHITAVPRLSVDWRLYEGYLANSNLTDQQKEEVITALLELVVAFVDLGFSVESPNETCEQVDENRILLPDDLLKSLHDAPSIETPIAEDDAHHRPTAQEKPS